MLPTFLDIITWVLFAISKLHYLNIYIANDDIVPWECFRKQVWLHSLDSPKMQIVIFAYGRFSYGRSFYVVTRTSRNITSGHVLRWWRFNLNWYYMRKFALRCKCPPPRSNCSSTTHDKVQRFLCCSTKSVYLNRMRIFPILWCDNVNSIWKQRCSNSNGAPLQLHDVNSPRETIRNS